MFKFKFAAICRTDKKSHIHHLSTIASSEREARRQFAQPFCSRSVSPYPG